MVVGGGVEGEERGGGGEREGGRSKWRAPGRCVDFGSSSPPHLPGIKCFSYFVANPLRTQFKKFIPPRR